MSISHRMILWTLLATSMLGIGVMWSLSSYQEARRRLSVVLAETARCQTIADELKRQRESAGASTVSAADDPFNRRFYQAASDAGLSPQQAIRAVRPLPPQREGKGNYGYKSVELTLDGLTMEQLVRFMHRLQSTDSRLQLASLMLHDPEGSGSGAQWSVQPLVVRQRVYLGPPEGRP